MNHPLYLDCNATAADATRPDPALYLRADRGMAESG